MTKNGLFHRLVLATVLAAGFLFLWGVVGLWSVEMFMVATLMMENGESLSFLADGSPVVAHRDGGKVTHRNLAGQPVAVPENEQFGWLDLTRLPPHPPRKGSGDVSWEERIRTFDDGRTPRVVWHFVSDGRTEGMAYFVGYDSHSKARVGYLGTAGFRAEMPPPEELFPFGREECGTVSRVFSPDRKRTSRGSDRSLIRIEMVESEVVSGRWVVYVFGRDRKLYQADVRKGTVRILLDEPGLCFVTLLGMRQPAPQAFADRLAARTEDAVLVLDSRGGIQKRYPIPEALRGQPLSFGETSGGEAVMYSNSEQDIFLSEVAYHICHVTTDGQVREEAVTLASEHPMQSSLRAAGAAVVPAPLVLDALVAWMRPSQLCNDGFEPTYSSALRRSVREFWPSLALAQLMAALLAWLCYRRQVRYGASQRERWIWPLFVLLLGLPGWIGYRFGHSWPVLESCAECGVSVPRDRVECVRCAAEFVPPVRRGTEVFA